MERSGIGRALEICPQTLIWIGVCWLDVSVVSMLSSWFWEIYTGDVGECHCFCEIYVEVFWSDGTLCQQVTVQEFRKDEK